MVEKAHRTPDETPRGAQERRWEVFVRSEEAAPLRRVGTVAAPSPEAAHDEASTLFAWYARDVWLCPTDETHRFSTYSLAGDHGGDAHAEADPDGDGGGTDATESTDRGMREPRVYEETEGTPNVRGNRDDLDK